MVNSFIIQLANADLELIVGDFCITILKNNHCHLHLNVRQYTNVVKLDPVNSAMYNCAMDSLVVMHSTIVI